MLETARRLLLFDIDGTLVDTGGAGLSALLSAAEECLGVQRDELPALDLAGATDGAVVRTLFEAAGHELSRSNIDAYHAAYLKQLALGLTGEGFCGHLLPGVREVVEALAADPGLHLGLLTGNIREGARLKLERFDLADWFVDGAFGDDAENRNELGPIAIRRLSAAVGASFDPSDVVIIGDTPKDIACAAACGARCLAVATGRFSMGELAAHGPWEVVPDLRSLDEIVSLLSSR